jgi:hypothetical protein
MQKKKIKLIIKKGEGLNREFKECKEDIFKTIIPLSKQVAKQVPSKYRAS